MKKPKFSIYKEEETVCGKTHKQPHPGGLECLILHFKKFKLLYFPLSCSWLNSFISCINQAGQVERSVLDFNGYFYNLEYNLKQREKGK